MLNTGWNGAINPDAELAKFEVSGWDSENNNVSVTVAKKDPNTNEDRVYEIPFPKAGKAPKIVAVKETDRWMNERSAVPTGWFY